MGWARLEQIVQCLQAESAAAAEMLLPCQAAKAAAEQQVEGLRRELQQRQEQLQGVQADLTAAQVGHWAH